MSELKVSKLLFVTALLLLLSTIATAVPANPNPFTLTQPDGTTFTAKLIGDERSYRVETITGYTIVQDSDNYWTYAQDANGILTPSSYRVGSSDPRELGLSQHMKSNVKREVSSQAITYPAIGEYDTSVYSVMNGSKKVLVILINFTEMYNASTTNPSAYPGSYYTNLIFSMSNNMSMNRYYNETSRNLIVLNGSVGGNKWYTSNYNESHWGEDWWYSGGYIDDNNDCIFNLAREALIKADNDTNYSQFDTDADGKIESGELAIIIVHAGCGEENGNCLSSTDGNAIWSHAWTIYGSNYGTGSFFDCTPTTFLSGSLLQDLILDGVRLSANTTSEYSNCGLNCVGKYTMLAESSPMGTFAHEFGHFLGLPDLYDTDYSSSGVGEWDIMSSGSWLGGELKDGTSPAHFSAWSKYFLGWINPVKLNSTTQNVQVTQVETNGSVYMIFDNPNDSPGNLDWTSQGTGTGEYFLIENRQKVGFDSYLPGAGILIWHVDETRMNNTVESRLLVNLEQADGLNNLNNNVNRGDAGDPFASPKNFTCTSTPNSKFYNNSCQFNITGISSSSGNMLLNVTVGTSVASGECSCSNCNDCISKLNNNSCLTVKLTASITNYNGTCIYTPANFTNKTFDC